MLLLVVPIPVLFKGIAEPVVRGARLNAQGGGGAKI